MLLLGLSAPAPAPASGPAIQLSRSLPLSISSAPGELSAALGVLRERRDQLTGASNKKARQKLNKRIRELEGATHVASPSAEPAQETVASVSPLRLDSLPPFEPAVGIMKPTRGQVQTALSWAWQCSTPPFSRVAFQMNEKSAELTTGVAPALQWLNTVWHIMVHHADRGWTRFNIEDDAQTACIMLEITGVRACPDGLGDDILGGQLSRANFRGPISPEVALATGARGDLVGAVPLVQLKYVHAKSPPSDDFIAALQTGGVLNRFAYGHPFDQSGSTAAGVMKIRAASGEEVAYGARILASNRAKLRQSARQSGVHFQDSFLSPPCVDKMERANVRGSASKLREVCSYCGADAAKGQMKRCARCKVTMYCDANCQKLDWKETHKHVCREPEDVRLDRAFGADDNRPSVLYNVEEAVHPALKANPAYAMLGTNFKRGNMTSTLSTKELKTQKGKHDGRSLYDKGVRRQTNVGNIHGSNEFIVKLQPPIDGRGPWLCYDEARSFESYIAETTDGMERCELFVCHFDR